MTQQRSDATESASSTETGVVLVGTLNVQGNVIGSPSIRCSFALSDWFDFKKRNKYCIIGCLRAKRSPSVRKASVFSVSREKRVEERINYKAALVDITGTI